MVSDYYINTGYFAVSTREECPVEFRKLETIIAHAGYSMKIKNKFLLFVKFKSLSELLCSFNRNFTIDIL